MQWRATMVTLRHGSLEPQSTLTPAPLSYSLHILLQRTAGRTCRVRPMEAVPPTIGHPVAQGPGLATPRFKWLWVKIEPGDRRFEFRSPFSDVGYLFLTRSQIMISGVAFFRWMLAKPTPGDPTSLGLWAQVGRKQNEGISPLKVPGSPDPQIHQKVLAQNGDASNPEGGAHGRVSKVNPPNMVFNQNVTWACGVYNGLGSRSNFKEDRPKLAFGHNFGSKSTSQTSPQTDFVQKLCCSLKTRVP